MDPLRFFFCILLLHSVCAQLRWAHRNFRPWQPHSVDRGVKPISYYYFHVKKLMIKGTLIDAGVAMENIKQIKLLVFWFHMHMKCSSSCSQLNTCRTEQILILFAQKKRFLVRFGQTHYVFAVKFVRPLCLHWLSFYFFRLDTTFLFYYFLPFIAGDDRHHTAMYYEAVAKQWQQMCFSSEKTS